MSKLFSLKCGDKFLINDELFTIKRFCKRKMPSIGKVMVCKTINRHNQESIFTINWDVNFMGK